MKKFEGMVREKGWFNEPVLKRLRADLGNRLDAIAGAARNVEKAKELA